MYVNHVSFVTIGQRRQQKSPATGAAPGDFAQKLGESDPLVTHGLLCLNRENHGKTIGKCLLNMV